MRKLASGLFVLLVCLPAAAQTASSETPEAATPKPAWQWSLDERIAKRLDPALIRERTQARERDRVEKDGFTPEVLASVGLVATPVRFIIEGRRDPELLMPFELFGSIIEGVEEPDNRSGTRSVYRDEIRESGWEEELFWTTLQEATAEYMQVQIARFAMNDEAQTLPTVERRALSNKADALKASECGLRAEALQTVRKKLGGEKFDRFLYERVAPNVGISSDFPLGNEEWRLRYIEGGCR